MKTDGKINKITFCAGGKHFTHLNLNETYTTMTGPIFVHVTFLGKDMPGNIATVQVILPSQSAFDWTATFCRTQRALCKLNTHSLKVCSHYWLVTIHCHFLITWINEILKWALVCSVPWIKKQENLCWWRSPQWGGVELVSTVPGMDPHWDWIAVFQIPAFPLGFYLFSWWCFFLLNP